MGSRAPKRSARMTEISAAMLDAKSRITNLRADLKAAKDAKNDADLFQTGSRTPKVIGAGLRFSARRVLSGHTNKVYSVDWSGDSVHLVSASADGYLMIWNGLVGGKENFVPLKSQWVMTSAYAASGARVASGGLDNTVTVFDTRAAHPARSATELLGHTGYVSCARFLNDRRIISASGDQTIALWDIETRTALFSLQDHVADVMFVSPSADARTAVSGSCDATARLWDLRTASAASVFTGHESDINCVAWSPSGSAFASASDDGSLKVWDVRADRLLASYTRDAIVFGITSVGWSASGRLLLAGYDDFAGRVWDVVRGEAEGAPALRGHENRVSALAVAPDGAAVATGSWDMKVKIWA